MKTFQLRSTFPCLVKWNGGEEFLDETAYLEFDSPQKFCIYPALPSRTALPFMLDTQSNLCPARIIDISQCRIFFLDAPEYSTTVKESLRVNSKTINFKISNNFVEIENDEMIKTCSCIKPRSYQLFSHDKFAILIIKSDRAQQAIVFDSANANISRLQADKIEFKDGELVCENANLQQRHLITSEGFIQNNNLQPSPRNAKTLCATFLQLLKEKQYSRANNLVCESLNSSQEKLAEYFGEFQNFFALDETKFVIIKKSGHNVVTFGLKDDKICDIQMD